MAGVGLTVGHDDAQIYAVFRQRALGNKSALLADNKVIPGQLCIWERSRGAL